TYGGHAVQGIAHKLGCFSFGIGKGLDIAGIVIGIDGVGYRRPRVTGVVPGDRLTGRPIDTYFFQISLLVVIWIIGVLRQDLFDHSIGVCNPLLHLQPPAMLIRAGRGLILKTGDVVSGIDNLAEIALIVALSVTVAGKRGTNVALIVIDIRRGFI